ncbi:exosome nuclease subunit [Apiotrichum porosum]|uniref:Exosome nuclease subunit n=1 Tax=Apiotrichum porosum TaxID=105984 RepID=A0A427XG72_9TREE|nr:exosome nuclease subunit [Apiotrichum porosum]RSH77767.1 exosome nuclease subunit [Apiotrichum porosum]
MLVPEIFGYPSKDYRQSNGPDKVNPPRKASFGLRDTINHPGSKRVDSPSFDPRKFNVPDWFNRPSKFGLRDLQLEPQTRLSQIRHTTPLKSIYKFHGPYRMSRSPSEVTAGASASREVATLVDNLTKALEMATTAANLFPDKSDISFHRTLDRRFAKDLDETSNRLLLLTDRLASLAVEANPQKGKHVLLRRKLDDEDAVVDSFRSGVIQVVDRVLEDADAALDEARGENKKSQIEVNKALAAAAGKKLPGPRALNLPGLAPHMQNDNRIPKPQDLFRDRVDNSAIWRPQLTEKAHAMVPLGYVVGSDEDTPFSVDPATDTDAKRERRERALYHPYYYETVHLPYPTSMFEISPAVHPASFEDTPFEFVDTPERLAALTEELLRSKEIAVDLEHHSMRTYNGITCLMQISTRKSDWVVDTLALRAELRDHKLGGVLADPSILKVFHGADSDIVWLQRDFDIYIVNLFDTYHASKVLDFPQFSLASLLQLYCDFAADKQYQKADWRIRPLPKELMDYARSDTHFLLYIYDKLRNALLTRSSRTPSPAADADENSTPKPNPQAAMREVLSRSAETALKLWANESPDSQTGNGVQGWAGMIRKLGPKTLDTPVGSAFKALVSWRENLAREVDESPHYIVPNHLVLSLAHLRPTSIGILSRSLANGSSSVALERADEVLEVIRNSAKTHPKSSSLASRVDGKPSAAVASSSTLSAPPSKRARSSTIITSDQVVTEDIWADFVNGRASVASASKPVKSVQSSLFGSALGGTKKTGATSSPEPSKAAVSSSLFGKTLKRSTSPARAVRDVSPGFDDVMRSFATTMLSKVEVSPVEPSSAQPAVAEPESVAFVPAAKRKNASSEATSATNTFNTTGETDAIGATAGASSSLLAAAQSATALSNAALVDAEGIVSVKKKKGRKPQTASAAASASSSVVPSEATTPVSVADKAAPKKKKEKIKREDIPTFDYAAEPNFLDDPKAATKNSATAKAKPKPKPKADKKKKKSEFDSASFGRAPLDPSGPKAGNKSATF